MTNELQSWEDVKVKAKPAPKKKVSAKKKVSKKKVAAKAKPDTVVFQRWDEVNAAVLSMDETEAAAALAAEIAGPNRRMFKLRLHSRLNKMRAHRERRELVAE